MIITKASIDLPVLVSTNFRAASGPKRCPARAISKTRHTELVKDFVEKLVTRDPCWAGFYPSIPAQSKPINKVDIVNAHARVPARYRTIEQSDVEGVGNDDGDVEHSDLELIEANKEPKRSPMPPVSCAVSVPNRNITYGEHRKTEKSLSIFFGYQGE